MTYGWRRRAARAVALGGVVLAVTAVPSSAATRPTLVRQLTITGDQTGWVAVTLPKAVLGDCAAMFDCRAKAVLKLSGGAFGFSLVYDKDNTSLPVPGAATLRLPQAEGGHIAGLMAGVDPRTGIDSAETRMLPAGPYRLFLLTKGRGSVTVRFPELGGTSLSVKPTRSTPYRAVEVAPSYTGPLAPSAWASGITVDPNGVRSRGYAFQWTYGAIAASSVQGGCLYENGAPPGGHWIPGCPGGQSLIASQLVPERDCCQTGHGIFVGVGEEFSFGQYYVQGGPVTRAGMYFVWLPER